MANERGEAVKWRAHFNQLISRPIPRTAFPALVERMKEDGLFCDLHGDGYTWYSGRYPVTPKAVRDMWSLSPSQWSRFMRYIYEEDPFSESEIDGEESV